MKKLLLLFLFLLLSSQIYGQNYRITFFSDMLTYADPGDYDIIMGGYVHNQTDQEIKVSLFRDQTLPDGWTTSMCLGDCYPSWVDRIDDVPIAPHDSVFFDVNFSTSTDPDSGSATLSFWDGTTYEQYLFTTITKPTFQATMGQDTVLQVADGETALFQGMLKNTSLQTRVYQVSIEDSLPENWSVSSGFGYEQLSPGVNLLSLSPGDSMDFYVQVLTAKGISGTGSCKVVVSDTALSHTFEKQLMVNAQVTLPAFSMTVLDSMVDGKVGQSFELGGYVYNHTDSALTITMIRTQTDLPDNWSTSLCFDVCVTGEVDSVSSLIAPGDSLKYSVTFDTDTIPGTGWAMIQFYGVGTQDTIYQKFTVATSATGIDPDPSVKVKGFHLYGNYPNPFNPVTTIRYQLEKNARVKIDLFTIDGRFVTTLFTGIQNAGTHRVKVNAADLPSGVYYYRLKTESHTAFGRMTLIK